MEIREEAGHSEADAPPVKFASVSIVSVGVPRIREYHVVSAGGQWTLGMVDNDLSYKGNFNIIGCAENGAAVYCKDDEIGKPFGFIGLIDAGFLIDANIAPDMSRQP